MGEMAAPMDGWTSMGSGVFIVRDFGWKIAWKSLKVPYKGGLFYHGFGIHSFKCQSFTNAYPHDSWSNDQNIPRQNDQNTPGLNYNG